MSEAPADTGDPNPITISTIPENHTNNTIDDSQSNKDLVDLLQQSSPALATVQPREQVITTAISFLQHHSVKRNPLNQKQQFLRSKGLTEDEIQIACERAGVFTVDPNNSTVINMGITASPASSKYCMNGGITPSNGILPIIGNNNGGFQSTLQKIRDILGSTALVAGIAYAIYLFYKNYIKPFLFGNDNGNRSKRKRKTLEESMEDLSKNVERNILNINQELTRIKEEVIRTSRQDSLHREISNFKSDLDAIKGLLLNRKQFSSPVLPPSIPVWQLQSQHTQVDNEIDKHDDAGSGSGSSETEVVTKNSDSSLELI